jgi:uncharacterized protein
LLRGSSSGPPRQSRPPVTKEHREAAKAPAGGLDGIGDFLKSRQGQAMQKEVVRGVFGMLKKAL